MRSSFNKIKRLIYAIASTRTVPTNSTTIAVAFDPLIFKPKENSGSLKRKDRPTISTVEAIIFNELMLNIAFFDHFQLTKHINTKIIKSVAAVPIATPTAGLFLNTNTPNMIDNATFNSAPPKIANK